MEKSTKFIEFLRSIANRGDKQALSAIKQGLTKTREHYAYKYLVPFCDLSNQKDFNIYKTIGALFATYPKEDINQDQNIGHLSKKLKGNKETDPYEKKILRLLSCETPEEALEWIKQICFLAKSNGYPFPFEKTIKDLLNWNSLTKKNIAKAFWNKEKGDNDE